VNTPEEIIALAGTRPVVEYSTHYGMDGATGEGSARLQHEFKVDPNHVRALPAGVAFIISRGRAMKAHIEQAPNLTTPLPEPTTGASGSQDTPAARTSAGRTSITLRSLETMRPRHRRPPRAAGRRLRRGIGRGLLRRMVSQETGLGRREG
jgi:hypothetical protein